MDVKEDKTDQGVKLAINIPIERSEVTNVTGIFPRPHTFSLNGA
jgi:hypothetical protein